MRLTNSIREDLLNRIINSAFDPNEFNDELAKIADDAYSSAYNIDELRMLMTATDRMFNTANHLIVRCEPYELKLNMSASARIAHSHRYGLVVNVEGDLAERFIKLCKAKDVRDTEKLEASASARSILWSCNTMKKLLEVWPEIEKFTKTIAPEYKTALPMVQISELNKALKLP